MVKSRHAVHLPDMIYHVVVGDLAAKPLREAIAIEDSMQGEVIVLKDILNVGPLRAQAPQGFSQMRSRFWEQVKGSEAGSIVVDDLERILSVSNALQKSASATIWFWLSPLPADACAYYWLLANLKKHDKKLFVVSIGGLPFLDEQGKVFFPTSISEAPPKELIKARKLARLISPSEWEIDGEEWLALKEIDSGIRVTQGGKKLVSYPIDYYDQKFLDHLGAQTLKANRLLQLVMTKENVPVGDVFLSWRIREMTNIGLLKSAQDSSKSLREIEVSRAESQILSPSEN